MLELFNDKIYIERDSIMKKIKFILVPEKDSWQIEGEQVFLNIFWLQKCPDVVLEQLLEKKLGFIPHGGDIDALRYPKEYEIVVSGRISDE